MRIAFATDDGEDISAHFGRAQYYLMVDVENGSEVRRELVHKSSPEEHVHAEIAAGDLAIRDQLRDDFLGRVNGDGETKGVGPEHDGDAHAEVFWRVVFPPVSFLDKFLHFTP